MSQRTTPRQSTLRTRAAVLAGGLGVATALGAGVAFAANDSGDAGAPRASATAADHQHAEKAGFSQVAGKKETKRHPTWAKPVSKYTLSATFGIGGGRWAHNHSGQDFAVPVGTNVKAAHDGTVVKAAPTVPVTAPRTATPSSSSTATAPARSTRSTRTCPRSR